MQGKKMMDQNIIGTKQWGETGKKLKLRKEKKIFSTLFPPNLPYIKNHRPHHT